MAHDLTIRELQTNLPWTVRYSEDFRANPQSHKDFAHALLHITKAAGMLAALVDDMDHRKETADDPGIRTAYEKYLADFVICALRAANTFPGGVVDLQTVVESRLESKNRILLPRKSPAPPQWPKVAPDEIVALVGDDVPQVIRDNLSALLRLYSAMKSTEAR